jgi:mRNA interferase HigB
MIPQTETKCLIRGASIMRVAGREKLEKFMRKHAAAKKPLSVWLSLVERELWQGPQDIKNLYRSVDFLSANRVVFNIGGNNFRLVVVVRYTASVVWIDRIGTHSEYEKWKLE